jgi:hypothetical protein
MKQPKMAERYSEEDMRRRTEAALRAAFSSPHKTYEESKVGKRKGKPGKGLSKKPSGRK